MTFAGVLRRPFDRLPGRWHRPLPRCCLTLGSALLLACSAATRERLTEALFDDPPSRRPPPVEAAPPAPEPRTQPVRVVRWSGSTHGPYAAQLCRACHLVAEEGRTSTAAGALLRLPTSALCRQCHGDSLLAEPARLAGAAWHGPAAAGLCLACHLPHRSREPFLLRSPAAEVCLGCHLRSNLLPDHPGEGRGCLECHDAHTPDRTHAL